jgi:hypothetical protein
MTGLGPEATALLEAAREGDEPTRVDMDRVRAAIGTRVATGAAAGLAATAVARWSASALGASGRAGASAVSDAFTGWATKALIAAALAAAVGASAASVLRAPPRAAAPAPVADTRASAHERSNRAVDAPLGTSEGPAQLPQALAQTVAVAAPPRSASGTGDVAAEVRLLGEAQTAIRGGEPARSLRLLDEHARRYPEGALGEERDAMRIAALCALGRDAEARRATERFLRAAPQSPHAGPLRASCGGSP